MPDVASAAPGEALAVPSRMTGTGETTGVSVGWVASRFTVNAVAVADSPALFVHEPVNALPVVSSLRCWSAVHVTGPLIVSAPDVCTVTSLVYQPFEPSVPMADKAAVGGVSSSFTVTEAAFVVRPALLVQCPSNAVPTVSAVWFWSAVQLSMPLTRSVPDVCRVTSLVYQPFAPGVPFVTVSVALGPLLSYL